MMLWLTKTNMELLADIKTDKFYKRIYYEPKEDKQQENEKE